MQIVEQRSKPVPPKERNWARVTPKLATSPLLWARRSGVTPITLHGLRDTHASLCAKASVPLGVVSQRLGHASIGITAQRYLHVYWDRDADAADAFGRLVG